MTPIRRAVLAALLAGGMPLAAACGAGYDATTQQYYSPADGVQRALGHMRLLNVLLVAPAPGSTDATLAMTAANEDILPDTVTEISSPLGPVEILGPREVPASGTLQFGGASAETAAVLRNFTGQAGGDVALTVRFARNAPIEVQTVVVPYDGYYRGFVLTPTPGAEVPSAVPGETPPPETQPAGGPPGGVPGGVPAPAVSSTPMTTTS